MLKQLIFYTNSYIVLTPLGNEYTLSGTDAFIDQSHKLALKRNGYATNDSYDYQ